MNSTPDHPDTEPLDTEATTASVDATDSGIAAVPAAPARRRRRALWIALATVALAAVATAGTVAITTAVQHTQAAAAFEEAVSDHADAATAQEDALTTLGDAEVQAVLDYTQLFTIGTTLTDDTVADAATRAAVLDTAAMLAKTAWLELDDTSLPATEQTPALTGLTPSTVPAPAEDLDALAAQTADLNDDTDAVTSYTDLVTSVTADITTATGSGLVAVDAALESAAAKGATLVYDRAPTETATVSAAAAALITDEARGSTLEEKTALVQGYIAAVNAASAQQQAVLAAEQAEADRLAAEQQRQSQNGTRNGTSNGGTKPGGSTGGSNPGSGGSNPGNGGSTPNPGNGGGSNWQPLKLVVTGSTCSATSGQQVTYGSTINVPGVNLDTYSTYEIPGYGWGATWKCKYW